MNKTVCAKCNYVRLPTDTAPAYECPHCGEFYELSLEPLEKENKKTATATIGMSVTNHAPQKASHIQQPNKLPQKTTDTTQSPTKNSIPTVASNSKIIKKTKPKGKICPKCSYERQTTDTAPDYECPKCGIIYNKYPPLDTHEANEKGKKRGIEKKLKIKIPALPLTVKLSVHIALAITISIIFSLPELLKNLSFQNWTIFWLANSRFSPGIPFFAILLAMIPASLLIYLAQLWQRIEHNQQRTHLMLAFTCIYIIATTQWVERLAYISQSALISFTVYLLIIVSALGSLTLLIATLTSLRAPNLNIYGKPKLLR